MKLSPAGINTEIGPTWDTPETPWARDRDLAPPPPPAHRRVLSEQASR